MRKELITALATVLTSTMVTIPVQAARPNMDSTQQPFDPNATAVPVGWTQEEADINVGPIEEDTAIMDAFGGVDKYRASYEVVTPEYFRQKYSDIVTILQEKVDTTSTDTIIASAAAAVNDHFTKDFSVVIPSGLNYGYITRVCTDYLSEGRMFSSYEPAVLLSFILKANNVPNDVYANYIHANDGFTVKTESGKYISVGLFKTQVANSLVADNAPEGIWQNPFYTTDMGAYEDYIK